MIVGLFEKTGKPVSYYCLTANKRSFFFLLKIFIALSRVRLAQQQRSRLFLYNVCFIFCISVEQNLNKTPFLITLVGSKFKTKQANM